MRLLPTEPGDVAERLLLRGQGHIFLASSSSIGEDLPTGSVVLAIDVAAESLPEAPLREGWGEPPRVEIQLTIPMSESLPLVFADRLDRKVELTDLDAAVQAAIELLADSPFGRQLNDRDHDVGGWCQTASVRFLSALRGQGSDGTLLSWGHVGGTWWHCTVQLKDTDVVVDWTARQFDPEAPCPCIETRTVAEARMNLLPAELDIDTAFDRRTAERPEVPAWSDAEKRFTPPPSAPPPETN
jgi:hypothetical protein